MPRLILFSKSSLAWWGPPKDFDKRPSDRRVSWLELFYDLVYVIAISRITHFLTPTINFNNALEYVGLFALIFWGWLNGSLYYDLHGNEGLRTRLITLWQMMIIAALAITLQKPVFRINITVVFMIMQLFISYLWWSVGFYDRRHRRYSRPYMIFFLLAFFLMAASLLVGELWLLILLPLAIICNYLPPFTAGTVLRHSSVELDLSPSMYERLGLFTIILFGEVVLGVVTGASRIQRLDFGMCLDFAFSLSIVFALWWIFFTLVANRQVKKGFITGTILELLYLPALIALGLMAAVFNSLFDVQADLHALQWAFGISLAIFLIVICFIMQLLVLPERVRAIHRPVRISLVITASLFLLFTMLNLELSNNYFLLGILMILIAEIIYMNSLYYGLGEGAAS